MNDSDKWSEYWQAEGRGGEVFVDADGNRHPALAEFWTPMFSSLANGASVIDIASGAGSIFSHLDDPGRFELHATDISAEALKLMEARMPGVRTHCGPAEALPYDDQSFELVVSQFGIEYGGDAAFAEAARLVAPGGRLVALVHIEDGYIDSRNAAELSGAMAAIDGAFIDHATAVTRAVFADDRAAFEAAAAHFAKAERALAEAHDAHTHGVHAHLYAGFRQLFENRSQYDEKDVVGWLDDMRGELERNVDRLTAMRRAAVSEERLARVTDVLRAAGLGEVATEHFMTPGNELPVAWQLDARR